MKRLLLFSALILSSALCEASNWFNPGRFTADSTEIYKTADGQDLELFIFYPDSGVPSEPTPTIVLFHGGGYTSGNPNSFFYACEYFTSRGMIAMSARYRLNNTEGARRDGKSAMRYVIENAARLGVDTDLLAAGGGSAGGNLAVTLTDPNNHNEPTDDLNISAAPDALVLFNPVGTSGYDNIDMPSTVAQWGDQDSFISPAEILANQQDALDAGVDMQIEIYEDQVHSWYDNSREWITITLDRADEFLETLGYVSGPPETNAWIAVVNNDTGTQAPVVAFTSPADGASFSEWSDLAVTVNASDPDAAGSIENVRLLLDGELIRIDDTAPYAWGPGSGHVDLLLESMAPGSYELEAVAYDNDDYVARETITVNLVDAPTEAPGAPTGLVSVPGDGGPYLDWAPNPEGDVSSYNVYRRDSGGSYGAPILTGVSADEATDTTAQVGATYFYRITAVDTDGNESAPSAEIEVTVESVAAEEVLATDNSWALAGNDSIQDAEEVLQVNRGDWASFARSAFIRFPLSGASELGGFEPDAIDRVSLDLYATATDADDPVRVFALIDGAQHTGSALSETTWTGGTNGTAAGGNNLTRNNRPDTDLNGTAPPNNYTTVELGTLTFASSVDNADVGLHRIDITEIEVFKQLLRDDTNQEITIILRADDGDQTTSFASLFNTTGLPVPTLSVFSVATASVPAPSDLAATSGDGEVSLAWTEDTVTNPVTYSIYRSTTVGSYGAAIATGLSTNSYLDGTVVNGTAYYYVVTATDGDSNESSPSGEVLAIPAASGNLPPAFTSDPIIEASVVVDETYSSTLADDASDPESNPMIFSKVSGPVWLSVATDGSLNGTAPASAGLNSFTVRVDAAGGSDTATLQITVDPDTTPPPVPQGLSAADGDGSVTLTWTDNGDSDTATYEVYRSTTSESYGSAIATGLATASYVDNAVVNDFTYFYVVTAVDSSGNESAQSDEVSATPESAPDSMPPAIPGGLAATAGDGFVSLDWDDNGELDLASYRIYRSTTSDSYGSALATSGSSSYVDSGLTNGTTYYYVVSAVDTSSNESAQSDEVSATPAEVSASLLADYSFDGSSMASFDSDANSVAGLIADGGGLSASYENRSGRGDPLPALKWTVGDMNDGTLLDSDYLSFTITPENDIALSFTELKFTFKFPNGSTQVALYTSQDGFTGDPVASYDYPGGGEVLTITLDLSTMAAASEAVEFRLYFDTSASFGSAELWLDNVQLLGTPGAIAADSDNDGMDDSWETTYFPTKDSIDGSLDSDGDGVLDFFEYLYGSIPNVASSSGFRLEAKPEEGSGAILIEWTVATGFVLGEDYLVHISQNLSSWDPLPEADYTLDSTPNGDKTEHALEVTGDYGDQVFIMLSAP